MIGDNKSTSEASNNIIINITTKNNGINIIIKDKMPRPNVARTALVTFCAFGAYSAFLIAFCA